jgi:hypothetical protein
MREHADRLETLGNKIAGDFVTIYVDTTVDAARLEACATMAMLVVCVANPER